MTAALDVLNADLEEAGYVAPPRVRTVAILDTETSGIDPAAGQLLEVAVVVYSVENADTIGVRSWLVEASENPAEAINGITPPLMQAGRPRADVMRELAEFCAPAEAWVAHNADFDRKWIDREIADLKPWICTVDDVAWPRHTESRGLIVLAVAHGVPVLSAHRALEDTLTLARLLRRVHELGHDVGAMLARGLRPKATYRAVVSFDDKEKARSAGFRWDPERKWWVRKMATEDVSALPFRAVEVPS